MKVLFVCTGNTCRSPMAEAIFNKLCDIEGVEAKSSGLSVFPSSVISDNSKVVVKDNLDVDLSYKLAVQFSEELFNGSDIILTMTKGHKMAIKNHFNDENNKVYTLCEFAGNNLEITDPYGGDLEIYKDTFTELKKHIEVVIEKIRVINN